MPGSTTELPDVDVKSLDSLERFFCRQKRSSKMMERKFLSKQKKTSQVVLVKLGRWFFVRGRMFQRVSSWNTFWDSKILVTSFQKSYSEWPWWNFWFQTRIWPKNLGSLFQGVAQDHLSQEKMTVCSSCFSDVIRGSCSLLSAWHCGRISSWSIHFCPAVLRRSGD